MMLWTWISWFSVNLLWNSVYCEKHYTNKIDLTWFIIVRQSCRLGQHRPIAKTHADGIVTVSDTGSKALMDQTLTDWLPKTINSSSEAFNKLKLYAQVCCHDLGMCTNKLWCCVDKVNATVLYYFLSLQRPFWHPSLWTARCFPSKTQPALHKLPALTAPLQPLRTPPQPPTAPPTLTPLPPPHPPLLPLPPALRA